jgi:aspartate ammonia-lyase
MINIYFVKPSRSIDIVNSVVKMTHIKINNYTQETKTVANISQYENIHLINIPITITYRKIGNDIRLLSLAIIGCI